MTTSKRKSRILREMHETVHGLHRAGVVSQQRMSEFDALCRVDAPDQKPLALSAEQKARLDSIASMLDEQIDYSDAPYLPDAVWTKATERLPSAKED